MYKNYVFDLYGTLVDINTNERKNSLWTKMAEIYVFNGARYTPHELRKEYIKLCKIEEEKLAKKFEEPEIKLEKVFKKLYENKGVKVDAKTILMTGWFFRITSTKYIKLYDGVIDILDLLKEKNKKIYLLSNAQQIFTEYEMKYLEIYDYFDGILFSSDVSCKKPSIDFYQILFDKYNLKKEESIMIGNDWIADIEGSNDFGIDNFYLHTNISPANTIIENVQAKYYYEEGGINNLSKIIK